MWAYGEKLDEPPEISRESIRSPQHGSSRWTGCLGTTRAVGEEHFARTPLPSCQEPANHMASVAR